MKIVLQNVIWLISFIAYNYAKEAVKIGVFFNNEKPPEEMPLKSLIYANNLIDQQIHYSYDAKLVSTNDGFSAGNIACNLSESDEGIAAIIGPESSITSKFMESLSMKTEIPHIQTTWMPSTESKSQLVLNFYPEPESLAKGFGTIVKKFHWTSFIVLYEEQEALARLKYVLSMQDYDFKSKRNTVILKEINDMDDYRPVFKEIKEAHETCIVLDCKRDNIYKILEHAKSVNMLEIFHSYFITSFDAHTVDLKPLNTSANITTVRINQPEREEFKMAIKNWELTEYHQGRNINLDPYSVNTQTALMHDAVRHFIECVNILQKTLPISTKSIPCNSSDTWDAGLAIANFMKLRKPSLSLTGPCEFDSMGKRTNFTLYYVQGNEDNIVGTWNPSNPEDFSYEKSEGSAEKAVVDSLQKQTIIVASRFGAPYLKRRKPTYEGEVLTGNARFEGFSMDFIGEIARELNFTFEFRLVKDSQIGAKNPITGEWSGIVGELIEHRAHLGITDFTMTHQRQEVIDFSMPFMTLGISILYQKRTKEPPRTFAFMEPFSKRVWWYMATLYIIVSIVSCFIFRLAPQDWENPHPCDDNPEELENIWTIKNSFWLTLGSIMAQGCDILPKGASSRVVTGTWWFFTLILSSSYTANLAAFLTSERSEQTISSAEDLATQNKIKYGCMDKGSTQTFFRDSNYSTYMKMWTQMESSNPSVFVESNDEGLKRVQTARNGMYAFLMESTQIEYETMTKCDLRQVGELLDSKFFGIGMPQKTGYIGAINNAVLKLSEMGRIGELKEKWWKLMRDEPICEEGEGSDEDSASLGLARVSGVFLVLGSGIAIAYLIAFIEFLWNVRNVSVDEHISYLEVLKTELKFAFNFWIEKKRTKIDELTKSSSSTSSVESGGSSKGSRAPSLARFAESLVQLNRSKSKDESKHESNHVNNESRRS